MLIVLCSNTAWSVYNFRRGLIAAIQSRGHQVAILAPFNELYFARLRSLGCDVTAVPMDNMGKNPWNDIGLLVRFIAVYRKLRPALVLNFTIKPVIYGSIATRALKIPSIAVITGLGTAFIRDTWLTRVVELLYWACLAFPKKVFFLNQDDMELFLKRKLIRGKSKRELLPGEGINLEFFDDGELGRVQCLPGSGINLSEFRSGNQSLSEDENSYFTFLLIARMLWDKGVGEFVEAAREIRTRYPASRFQLLGFLGVENATAVPKETLALWIEEGVVEYLGTTDDVRSHIEAANCIVLPSYREGISRTLLEAAAMQRPIITTNVTGCRDVVEDGVNGLLCKARDAKDLAMAMERMMAMPTKVRAEMGRRGREKVEREFDEQIVIRKYLSTMADIFEDPK